MIDLCAASQDLADVLLAAWSLGCVALWELARRTWVLWRKG